MISIAGVGISLGAMILVMSIMTALHDKNREKIFGVEPHLFLEFSEIKQPELLEIQPLSLKLQSESGARVQGVSRQEVILKSIDGHFAGAVAKGFLRPHLSQLISDLEKKIEGGPLRLQPEILPGEIAMGIDIALNLGIFEGDQIDIFSPESFLLPSGVPPVLERVIVKKIVASNVGDVDSQTIFFHEGETLKRFTRASSRQAILEVWFPKPELADKVKNSLIEQPSIKATTWAERNSTLFLSLRLEKLMMGVFLSMAALIAAFSLVSILVLLISQKQSEIGIMEALGMPVLKVVKLFRGLGWILGMCGVILGVLIGSGLAYVLELYPLDVFPSDIYYDTALPARWDGLFTVITLLAASLFCWGLSYFGSLQILKLSPIDAIKKKS